MARRSRVVLPNIPLHVTQRGNRRLEIYRDDFDRHMYLKLMHEVFQFYKLEILAYCLMTNHIHLIPKPRTKEDLSNSIRDLHSEYASYFNKKYDLDGHLWKERFYSTVLDEEYLWHAIRYVELNPVKAGIVARAELYKWSSAKAHCDLTQDKILSSDFPPPGIIDNWSEWLMTGLDCNSSDLIKRNSKTGRLTGSDEFIRNAERISGLSLFAKKSVPKIRPIANAKQTT